MIDFQIGSLSDLTSTQACTEMATGCTIWTDTEDFLMLELLLAFHHDLGAACTWRPFQRLNGHLVAENGSRSSLLEHVMPAHCLRAYH